MKIALPCILLLLPIFCESAPDLLYGNWQRRDFSLEFNGFMQVYACDELQEKLEILLKASGARKDLGIKTSCRFPDRPSEGARAQMEFFALTLPANATANAATAPETGNVAARWRKVSLRYGSPSDLKVSDCELLARFRDQLLPLFTIRHLVDRTHCRLGMSQPGDLDLQFEVLVPAGPD
ncbi:MAG TPA: hypothetical protein VF848_01925 [Steroidobacteraceae bacterium]